jgi:hypothetical protein
MPEGGRLFLKPKTFRLTGKMLVSTLACHWSIRFLSIPTPVTAWIGKPWPKFSIPFHHQSIGKGTGLVWLRLMVCQEPWRFIECYSQVGQGTTFKIYFPALKPPDAGEDRDVETGPPRGRGETDLLVDNEASIRDVGSRLLRRFGYTALTASRGEEALEIYAAGGGDINLIIMDLGMPGMGGHKCLRELIRINPAVRVIIASGYAY